MASIVAPWQYNATKPNPYYLPGGNGYYAGLVGPYDSRGVPISYAPPGSSTTTTPTGGSGSTSTGGTDSTSSTGGLGTGSTPPTPPAPPPLDPGLQDRIVGTYDDVAQRLTDGLGAEQNAADNNARDRLGQLASDARTRISNDFASRGLGGSSAQNGADQIGSVDNGEYTAVANALADNNKFYTGVKTDTLGQLNNAASNLVGLSGQQVTLSDFAQDLAERQAQDRTQAQQFDKTNALGQQTEADNNKNAQKNRDLQLLISKLSASAGGNTQLIQALNSILSQVNS